MTHDLVLRRLREQLAEADRALVDAFERRVELVVAVRERKAELGVPFVDRAQEERLVERLVAGREGAASAAGVRDVARTVLGLSRREAARSAARRCESVAEQVA